jgi:8-oxo-dGTP pyrophosphatase MutT (NUDIX family)
MSADFDLCIIDQAGWEKTTSRFVDVGPHVSIEQATFRTPTRASANWTIVHRKAAVAIAPMLPDGRLVLLSQERIPVQRMMWEFPAGQIDAPLAEVTPELITRTAIAELREELGAELAEGATLQPLGWYFPSPGFTQEHIYLFLANPVRITAQATPQHGESFGDVRYVTPDELRAMIARNEISNSLTLALFAKLTALRLIA